MIIIIGPAFSRKPCQCWTTYTYERDPKDGDCVPYSIEIEECPKCERLMYKMRYNVMISTNWMLNVTFNYKFYALAELTTFMNKPFKYVNDIYQ